MKRFLLSLLFSGLFRYGFSQSATFSKDYRIKAIDAYKHVGEWHEVIGDVFKVETKKLKSNLDSLLLVMHLTNGNKHDVDFVVLTKINAKKDSYFVNLIHLLKTAKYQRIQTNESIWEGNSAEGKIFLYKGRPAVLILPEDFGILDRKD